VNYDTVEIYLLVPEFTKKNIRNEINNVQHTIQNTGNSLQIGWRAKTLKNKE
jgi:hypothetical protein